MSAKKVSVERLQAFDPVADGEDVLDVLAPDDIDAVRYTTNTGFHQQDDGFGLDQKTVDTLEPYQLLERMEEQGDPTYLLQENDYRFTLAAVNTTYWNGYSYNRSGSVQGSGNYEVLEVHGDSRDGISLDTAPITEDEDVVDAYVEAIFS